jgi:hypothetical protein
MRVILNPCFDCDIWVDQQDDPVKMGAVKKIIEYTINRWAAYADIIEIANEPYGYDQFPLPGFDHLPLKWFTMVVTHIRKHDPYGHPVGQDLIKRHLVDGRYVELIDVLMPHWYHDGRELEQDSAVANRVSALQAKLTALGKPMPILYGEQGYQVIPQKHVNSPRWQRRRYWTSIFTGAGFIAWHVN